MIHTYDGSVARRILDFPAIHPCDAISPATLLSSLITLAGEICRYKPKFFPSNNRNARETIRLIGNLLIFLEEVRETQVGGVLLPESAILSFSELHFAFQKIRYLLADCCCQGARLYVSMKGEQIADEFFQLNRSIWIALNVLNLDDIDVSSDVKELVGLVMRQFVKGAFKMEWKDKEVCVRVISILSGFHKFFVPEACDVRWVLDALGIQSWIDCDEEIKFLDEEIALEGLTSNASENHIELTLLSNLCGLLCYCRCVLFGDIPSRAPRQYEGENRGEVLNFINLDDFRCPISLEIMADPVTTTTGQTYDRLSIQKWFKAGNSTCPKTGEKLASFELVPNLILRRLIHQFCSSNNISIGEASRRNRESKLAIVAGSPAAKLAANFLAHKLAAGTNEEKEKASYEIRLLTKNSVFNRSCLSDAGAIPDLLHLLVWTDSAITQEDVMAALLNLSKHSQGRVVIVENGGLKSISQVLKKGLKLEVKRLAAATLYYLAMVEEYRKSIGETNEAIRGLVELIKDGNDHGKKNALVAILALLLFPHNHLRVLAAGAIPMLVHILSSSQNEGILTDCLAVLSNLAENRKGMVKILLERRSLPILERVLSSLASRVGKEHCVSLLLALCINGGRDVVSVLAKSPSLMGSLYSQLADGTPRASKKASSLINLLHAFSEKNFETMITPSLHQERFVHVW